MPSEAPTTLPEAEPIPDAQLRALDRRHALDAQQREFDNGTNRTPAPHFWTRRPPG